MKVKSPVTIKYVTTVNPITGLFKNDINMTIKSGDDHEYIQNCIYYQESLEDKNHV